MLEKDSLAGRCVLLTAGPTWEAIDPVRGMTNHSSGKMGYETAIAAKAAGAEVVLISGSVCLSPPDGVKTIKVESALQMFDAVHTQIKACKPDVFIGVAAVADYRPAEVQAQKIKKSGDELHLKLIKNPDIVASVAALKKNRPYTVGFAAETQNLLENAQSKLISKQLDLIAANDVSQSDLGFGAEKNQLYLLCRQPKQNINLGKHSKVKLASELISFISQQLNNDK